MNPIHPALQTAVIVGVITLTGTARAATIPADDWWLTTDNGGGLKQSTWNSHYYFAVSDVTTWDPTATYEAPTGYRVVDTTEAQLIFNQTSNSGLQGYGYTYYNQNGWNGYNWEGENRYFFRFGDSGVTNAYKHAGNYDPYQVQYTGNTNNFAGMLLAEADYDPYYIPVENWLLTTDGFGGLKQSAYNEDYYYAVSQFTNWTPGMTLEIPDGFRWATSQEALAAYQNFHDSQWDYTYHGQGGWSGYTWEGANRYYFRFADSDATHLVKHTGQRDNYVGLTTTSTNNFAGLVLIREASTSVPAPTTLAMLVGSLWLLRRRQGGK